MQYYRAIIALTGLIVDNIKKKYAREDCDGYTAVKKNHKAVHT